MIADDVVAFLRQYPYAGSCAFCGADDKRHRLADAFADMASAGDSVAIIARDFGDSPAAVRGGIALAPTFGGPGESPPAAITAATRGRS